MKYMGSKARLAKHLLPIILENRKPKQYYVEPFVGGANMIDKVTGPRIGSDANKYLIALWKELQNGWVPKTYTKEEYYDVKANMELLYPLHVIGFVGFLCSYRGKWFAGYAGETKTKEGIRDYQKEAVKNIMEQLPKLKNTQFVNFEYHELAIPRKSIIYCDPPYQGTTKYFIDFDHVYFWEWCKLKTLEGNQVFISEYAAPDNFRCVWEGKVKSQLSANGKSGGTKISTEKLFIYEPLFDYERI